ncbi:MAG: major capsid protein [Microviridae sp.]|jgi:hypothetical protein|nr:MAG: major capsid protein [Microviridae sp.]
MNRNLVDLTNLAFGSGYVGRLCALNVLPVVAGDSMALDGYVNLRLTPFLRQLNTDVKIDVCSFYVPHRHIYGQDWIDFIKQGVDETVTFPTVAAANPYGAMHAIPWTHNREMPLWLVQGYLNIWNRYYRPPRSDIAERVIADGLTSFDQYGLRCANLPAIWNTGHKVADYPSDDTVPSATTFRLTEMAREAGEWESRLNREWKDNYYSDFMRNSFGTSINTDADQRPLMLAHTSEWVSGFDVYGTSGAAFGEALGRAQALVQHGFPRRMFPEHGAIWTLALVRYPSTHENEIHYLASKPQPTYAQIASDPAVDSVIPPAGVIASDLFRTTSAADLGIIPHGQWYRTQPNIVHNKYNEINGFAFHNRVPTSLSDAVLGDTASITPAFKSAAMLHWQTSSRFNVKCLRVSASSGSSVYAGTKL